MCCQKKMVLIQQKPLPEKEVSRLCLRALYSINYRYMKLTEEIKAIDNYDYVYKEMRQEDFEKWR